MSTCAMRRIDAADPIFAAIDRYKAAFAFHAECLTKADKLGEGEECERLQQEGCDAELDAFTSLVGTVPTTSAGAAAVLSFMLSEIESKNGGLPSSMFQSGHGKESDGLKFLKTLQAFASRLG